MFCVNASKTLQRKENYSMISVSVEESYLYLLHATREFYSIKLIYAILSHVKKGYIANQLFFTCGRITNQRAGALMKNLCAASFSLSQSAVFPPCRADQIKTSTSPLPPCQTSGIWTVGHLTIFSSLGVGNLTGKAFPAVGNLTFAWKGLGKLNRNCHI